MEATNGGSKETFRIGEYSKRIKITRTMSKEKLFHDVLKDNHIIIHNHPDTDSIIHIKLVSLKNVDVGGWSFPCIRRQWIRHLLLIGRILSKTNKTTCKTDQAKGRSSSRLPRIVRTPSKFYKPTKSSTKLTEKLDDSGDALAGPSKLANIPTKIKKEEMPEKLKPSQIPRRKSHKDGSKENSCDITRKVQSCNNNQFIPECRNVQRVQMLINPEFCPEERTQTTSVASTRPIPTLGQIYGRINMIDSDRLNDWFLELNTPMNSLSSNPRDTPLGVTNEGSELTSSTVASPPNCHQEDLNRSAITLDRKDKLTGAFATINENVNVWLTSDVEFPTRDNESGYQTMSQNAQTSKTVSQHMPKEGQSIKTINTYCLGLSQDIPNKVASAAVEPSLECSTGTSSFLKEQQTVVLCRTPDAPKDKVEEGTDISKTIVNMKPTRMSKQDPVKSFHYPLNVNHTSLMQAHRVPVPSYTECLSEILQKTTNFENIEGFEFSKAPSSIAGTDIRDNLSNEGTSDQMDDYGVVEDQSNSEWCRHQSNGNMTYNKSDTTGTDWSCKYQSEISEEDHHHHNIWHWKHDACKRYYSDSRYGDMRDRCKKCQKFKRFPSNRYKLPRTFGAWRRRISLRRICRRRWNHVWKKTAERWAMWSSRSPPKFRKFRVLHYLQRSIIWEDADAQTTLLVYNETGTDGSVCEQKSAGIGTMFNMGSWQSICNKSESGTKSRLRHVNLGPSMFPFRYNTSKDSKVIIPKTLSKGLPGSQFPHSGCETMDKEQNVDSNWINDHNINVCCSVKSCQYEDIIPVHVERSTSLLQMYEVNVADSCTDTEDLPYYMSDKVTSTLLRFSSYRIPSTQSKDAYTQKVITCQNAETDVTFLPNLEDSSSGPYTSGCDITYYRPLTGTDITHLITESRTQQALYPILRKFNSDATSVIREASAETETQMSPNNSANKISTGVTTSTPAFTEKTTSYTQGSMVLRHKTEKKDYAVQAQEPKPTATEIETQMTPESSKSIISTGITPSSPIFGDKASTFISACVLLDSDVEKENYAAQTRPTIQNLGFTATKIMSISSKMLADKNVASTEVTIEKPVLTNSGSLVPMKCSCKPRDVASCGTGTRKSGYAFTRSTSPKPLSSYFETEVLLSKLIKKALVGDVSPQHSQYSQHSESQESNRSYINYSETGTNTHVECVESKSIGQTESEIQRLIRRGKIDTGTMYNDMQERTGRPDTDIRRSALAGRSHLISMCMMNQNTDESSTQTDRTGQPARPLLYKCASMMTSYCGLAQSIQVPASTMNLLERQDKPICACAVLCCDTETNTETFSLSLAQPTQTLLFPPKRNAEEAGSDPIDIAMASKEELKKNVNSQLISLSRLIGKKGHCSTSPPITTPVYSSDFTADKWLKTCSSMDKTYDSLIGYAPSCGAEDLKRNSLYTGSSKSIMDETKGIVPVEIPIISLSKDSLADVLPSKRPIDFYLKKKDTQQSVDRLMVDEETSDENVTKDVKESILQACPEICETGTDSLVQMFKQKSASVLTTQCVLPSPSPCSGSDMEQRSVGECVFVYGEPRCAVHTRNADASVQMQPSIEAEVNAKRRQCVNHSVGVLTSCCATADSFSQRKPSTMIREVLSPKVYKALYETTKLVVSEDSHQAPARDSNVMARVDAEVEAAKFHVPDVRSAGVVTSVGRGFGFPQRCYCRDKGTHPNTKCALFHVTKAVDTEETPSDFTHAKLLHMPEETKEGCFEECMKTHLVTSCRYYSNLLTKQLGRVKENCKWHRKLFDETDPPDSIITKHLAQRNDENEEILEVPQLKNTIACTMKPSGKSELASQTLKIKSYVKVSKPISCCMLSPAVSLTNICKHDKDHLKSVYYMLSAIEGRLRRLKVSVPNSF